MERPQLSTTDPIHPQQDGFDGRPAVAAWLAHVEAGRIGGNPPPDLATVEKRLRMAALFREMAAWQRFAGGRP